MPIILLPNIVSNMVSNNITINIIAQNKNIFFTIFGNWVKKKSIAKKNITNLINPKDLIRDISSIWKAKDGRIVLLDAGALDNTIPIRTAQIDKFLQKDWDKVLADRRAAGMGKFVIVLTAGGQGYKILENQKIILDKNK